MILKPLVDFFDYLNEHNELDYGFSDENIFAGINIDENGIFIDVFRNSTIITTGKDKSGNKKEKEITTKLRVPIPVKDNNSIFPSFGFGYSQYLLGCFFAKDVSCIDKNSPVFLSIWDSDETTAEKMQHIKSSEVKKEYENLKKAKLRFEAFKEVIAQFQDCSTTVPLAVVKFYDKFEENLSRMSYDELKILCEDKIGFICGGEWLFDNEEFKSIYLKSIASEGCIDNDSNSKVFYDECLCCGKENSKIANNHLAITGVPGGQSSGTFLISFKDLIKQSNKGAKVAPICEECMNKYVRAIKYMIDNKDKYMVQIDDLMVFFWSKNNNPILKKIISQNEAEEEVEEVQDSEKYNVTIIKSILEAAKSSTRVNLDCFLDDEFYILGISANAARLSIRFFYKNDFNYFANNIINHFKIFNYSYIDKDENQRLSTVKTWQVNKFLKDDKKSKEQWVKSILLKAPYPRVLYGLAMSKIINSFYLDKKKYGIFKKELPSLLSIILGYYNISKEKEENYMNIEDSNMFQLGRLLAVVDKNHSTFKYFQNGEEFKGKGICDKYFLKAMNFPERCLPVLMASYNTTFSQMKKLEKAKGTRILFSQKVEEIISNIKALPTTSSISDRAEFILGFYQEKNNLRNKNKNSKEDNKNEPD